MAKLTKNTGLKKNKALIFKIVMFCLIALILLAPWGMTFDIATPIRQSIKHALRKTLVCERLPVDSTVEAAYILGGNYNSLRHHYKKAAHYYQKGICKKILFLHCDAKSRYSPELGRNLTKDEWSVRQLSMHGVAPADTEAVAVEEKFFGTYAEAESVSRLFLERDLKSLLLITSPYHTKRVMICFEHFLAGKNIQIFVAGSDDAFYLKGHIIEYIKFLLYECCLV